MIRTSKSQSYWPCQLCRAYVGFRRVYPSTHGRRLEGCTELHLTPHLQRAHLIHQNCRVSGCIEHIYIYKCVCMYIYILCIFVYKVMRDFNHQRRRDRWMGSPKLLTRPRLLHKQVMGILEWGSIVSAHDRGFRFRV